MPGKKTVKVNVEKRRAEYQKFISTQEQEFDIWKDLSSQKTYYKEITTTTYDITDNYEPFFDKLYTLAKAFKTKMKQKEFKYDYFRTFFFGGVGVRRDDSTDVEKAYDGLTRYIIKEDNDGALKTRQAFMAIYMALDEVNDLTEENFYDLKKKMKDALTGFVKVYEAHVKKHHKPIHEILTDFVKVLRDLLTSNFHYSLFEFQNQDPKMRKLNNFKEKALLDKLCYDMQEALRILINTGYIKNNPNMFVLTNKFQIKNWEENKIQTYFIKPLYESWILLRKEMSRLYVFGENHWVIPLGDNIEFTNQINDMIEKELVAERMIGSDLKRDQLNFLHNTVLYIFNSPMRDRLLGEGPDHEIIVEYVIPWLTVLRYLDHIVRITKAKRSDTVKQERMKEYLNFYRNGSDFATKTSEQTILIQEEGKIEEHRGTFMDEGPYKRDVKTPFITAVSDEDTIDDMEKFGRYWVWSDYFAEQLDDELLKGAEMLRKINIAVRQDLADEYVNTPLKKQSGSGHHFRTMAEEIAERKRKQESAGPIDKTRPPFVWNHLNILEKPHEHRAHVAPFDKKLYLDGRVREMHKQIDFLANELKSYGKVRWQEMVARVIGYFRERQYEEHKEIITVKLPQTF